MTVHNQHGRQHTASQRGFTLVEVIVVLGVILLLSGIAVPMISSYVDDGKRARAIAEVKMLSAAVASFYKDVGVFPARRNTTNNYLYTLLTGATQPTSNPYTASHNFSTWGRDASRGDVADNHLLRNAPQGSDAAAYPITGSQRWRGPYLSGPAPTDPWGRPYVITVIGSWYNDATRYKRMYVLCAGENGRIDTNYESTNTTDIAGDDVGVIIVERN